MRLNIAEIGGSSPSRPTSNLSGQAISRTHTISWPLTDPHPSLPDQSGELSTGERLEKKAVGHAGDYLYIPPGVPHVAVTRGATPAVFVGARTDANEQESVVRRGELDAKVP